MEKNIKIFTCCICGKQGECCDVCNYSLVVPARIAMATEKDFDTK